jgi:uncharacterized membrane protein required for colicin V production
MTAYDAVMIGMIVAGMVWGAFKGITWQVASILSLVLGYTVAHQMSAQLAPYMPGEPVVARAVAMIVVYVLTSGGVFFGAWLIRATLQRMKFEAYDRHLGMILGGAEGALLGILGTLFVVSLAPQTRGPIFASPTGKAVGMIMSAVGPVLPAEARTVLAPFWSGDGAVAAQDGTTPAPAGKSLGVLLQAEEDKLSQAVTGAAPQGQAKPKAASTGSLSGLIEQGEAQLSQAVGGQPGRKAPGQRDNAATPTSLGSLIQQEESRLGRAIADGAAQNLRNAAGGGSDDGTTQRR